MYMCIYAYMCTCREDFIIRLQLEQEAAAHMTCVLLSATKLAGVSGKGKQMF